MMSMNWHDYATFQGRRELHIKIPGKYKAEISLPAKIDKVVSNTWDPITRCITMTLQMVPKQKLVKSSNTLNV